MPAIPAILLVFTSGLISAGRRAFSPWNFIQPGRKLLPSGLLGPVSITLQQPL